MEDEEWLPVPEGPPDFKDLRIRKSKAQPHHYFQDEKLYSMNTTEYLGEKTSRKLFGLTVSDGSPHSFLAMYLGRLSW